jgi:hypothetical protein
LIGVSGVVRDFGDRSRGHRQLLNRPFEPQAANRGRRRFAELVLMRATSSKD